MYSLFSLLSFLQSCNSTISTSNLKKISEDMKIVSTWNLLRETNRKKKTWLYLVFEWEIPQHVAYSPAAAAAAVGIPRLKLSFLLLWFHLILRVIILGHAIDNLGKSYPAVQIFCQFLFFVFVQLNYCSFLYCVLNNIYILIS